MAKKIPWDKYEAVILLDGLIAVLNGKISRADAIKKISHDLRKMAQNRGMEIDDIYRNINGITFMISRMESAYYGYTISEPATKLFAQIADLYHNSTNEYNKLLQEAKSMVGENQNNKELFYNFVLSKYPHNANVIMAAMKSVEEFAIKTKIISESIYKNPSLELFELLNKKVVLNTFFILKNRKSMYNVKRAMSLFKRYVSLDSKIDSSKNLQKYIPQNKAPSSETVPTKSIINFNENTQIPFTKPTCYLYKGIANNDISSWTDLYVNVIREFINEFPKVLTVGMNFTNGDHVDFGSEQHLNGMKAPKRVKSRLYLETNLSATDIIKKIKGVMDLCDFDYNDLTIYYQNKNRTIVLPVEPEQLTDSDALLYEEVPEYLSANNDDNQLRLDLPEETFENVDFDKYKEILSKEYYKGFRMDTLSVKRLRDQWETYFGSELEYDDNTIYKHINHITLRHGDMVYLPQSLLDDTSKEQLMSYIDTAFSNGAKVIYYNALYKEFFELFSQQRINNADMLKTYLSYVNTGTYYLYKNYIAADKNVTVDHADEIRNYMITYGSAITYDELATALPHLPMEKIKFIILGSNSKEFVNNKRGEYFHVDLIELSRYELDLITEWITNAITEKGYMGGNELVDIINKKLPSIREKYPFLTDIGLRETIAYKLQDSFTFIGNIISAIGQDLSMEKVFSDFAAANSHFTLTQLNSLKKDLNTQIYFDAVYQNSLRINKEEFVSPDQAKFDIPATDSTIDRFCPGDFVSIKDISIFGAFPDAGFPWNVFLLQHYVANYSKKYKLLHCSFLQNNVVGAVVKQSSSINTFEEVIIKALAESKITLDRETALQYLCDLGFLAKRSYSNIERVIAKANRQRLTKGD